MSTSTDTRWTTVYEGSMSDVLVCQGLLESNGIATQVVDQNIKIIDPFITGGNAFTVRLQAPMDAADEARELLAWRPPDEDDKPSPGSPTLDLERLGNRIRWASILMFTAPYALVLSPIYLVRAAGLREKPRNHRWTLCAIVFAGASTLATVSILIGRR